MLLRLARFCLRLVQRKDIAGNYSQAWNEGYAGAFISKVVLFKETGIACMTFANAATGAADRGTDLLPEQLKKYRNGQRS